MPPGEAVKKSMAIESWSAGVSPAGDEECNNL
jgi:hypothetical protein